MMNATTTLYARDGIIWEINSTPDHEVALVLTDSNRSPDEANHLAHQFAATPQLVRVVLDMLGRLHTLRGCDAWCIKQYHWVFDIYDVE